MKTRSLNKLLILVRDHIQNKNTINSGICLEINTLWERSFISVKEKYKLELYMLFNRPKKGEHYDVSMKDTLYWWPLGQKEPRIAWLNSVIIKTKPWYKRLFSIFQ